jgi:hypothetical protein
MQVVPHGLDPGVMPRHFGQVVGREARSPHRARHADGVRVQLDHPLQFCQPGRGHPDRSAGMLARRQPGQAVASEPVRDRPHLFAPTPYQPGDLGDRASFVRQQDHLAVGALDGTARLLVARGHCLACLLIQSQPQRGGHRQHPPGLDQAG